MRIATIPVLLLGLAALQPQVDAANQPDPFQGLLDHSPFGTPESISSANAALNAMLEFHGVMEESGHLLFSIYDTTNHRSRWVVLNDPADGFSVESYDETKLKITVDYQGKQLTLPLTRMPTRAKATAPMLNPQSNRATAGSLPPAKTRAERLEEELRHHWVPPPAPQRHDPPGLPLTPTQPDRGGN